MSMSSGLHARTEEDKSSFPLLNLLSKLFQNYFLFIADFQSSELTIQRTRREHSGNFTCVASNTQPASVLVHIFKGDNPAAMYHGHVGGSTKSYQTHLHGIIAIIAMAYRILQTYIHVNLG
ncbi:uncharacterized protein LOC118743750 [Rhagoletis pomonella]|uniref:uncharacterized protein LOC118743750 n=1 Tax=Rhagoletis pomonella TaxID=28610 RepID=UPI001785A72D|nr:uncharacterized protein LOC118743750 [Rhagoletis pomonella]